MTLLKQYQGHLHTQEVFGRQKSRITWLKGGDSNTRFFYYSTILRTKQNRIHHLIDQNGNQVRDEENIRSILFSHFQNGDKIKGQMKR